MGALALVGVASGTSSCAWSLNGSSSVSTQYLESLLLENGYDVAVRPSVATNMSLTAPADVVEVQFVALSWEMNELDQTMTVRGYERLHWTDPRLRHEKSNCEAPWSLRTAALDKIWRPSIFCENERGSAEIKFKFRYSAT